MPKFSKRACSICGTIFQPRSEIHEYCSGGCRTEGHRKRHAIEEPAFLSNAKKSIDTPLKVVEGVSSEFSNKPLSTTDTILDFTDIGVTEYIANRSASKTVGQIIFDTLNVKTKSVQ